MLPASCGKPAPTPADTTGPDQTYTVKAVIDRLPQGPHALALHHEPIPQFVGKDGAVTGMREMVMDFAHLTPQAAASLANLNAGDAVEFTFEVRWKAEPRSLVTAIKRLPAGDAPKFEMAPK